MIAPPCLEARGRDIAEILNNPSPGVGCIYLIRCGHEKNIKLTPLEVSRLSETAWRYDWEEIPTRQDVYPKQTRRWRRSLL